MIIKKIRAGPGSSRASRRLERLALHAGRSSFASPKLQASCGPVKGHFCALLREPSANPSMPLDAWVHYLASLSLSSRCQLQREETSSATATAGALGLMDASKGTTVWLGMKCLKLWWSVAGGLLHLTVLLSLAGLHLDLGSWGGGEDTGGTHGSRTQHQRTRERGE